MVRCIKFWYTLIIQYTCTHLCRNSLIKNKCMYMYFNANVGYITNLSLYFTPTRQNESYSKGILYDETFSLSIITGVWKRSFPCLHLAPRVGIKYFLSLKHICKTSKWAPKHNYIGSCLCDNRSSGNALSYRKASYLAPNKREI